MALPAIPALGAIGKSIGLGGAFAGGSRVVSKYGSRVSGWLGRNTGRVGAGAGGAFGGFGLASIMDSLGIQDDRLRRVTMAGVVLAAIFAIGQLVDVQVGGN